MLMTSLSAGAVQVVREVPVSRDRLFAAWTAPEVIAAWWGPRAEATVDLNPGGRYRWSMQWGDESMAILGHYEEIVPRERVACSFAWEGVESEVTRLVAEFRDTPAGSAITLTHTGLPDAQQVANHTQGWNDCLDRMVAYLNRS